MKKLHYLLSILVPLLSFSQNGDSNETQKAWFHNAEIKLEEASLFPAYVGFYKAHNSNPNTELGKISLHKSDSVKSVLAEQFKKKIFGTWKLRESHSNWESSQTLDSGSKVKLITVSPNQIIFVEKNLITNESEQIDSKSLTFKGFGGLMPPAWTLHDSDGAIWNYVVKNDGGILEVSRVGEVKENGAISFIACGVIYRIYERANN